MADLSPGDREGPGAFILKSMGCLYALARSWKSVGLKRVGGVTSSVLSDKKLEEVVAVLDAGHTQGVRSVTHANRPPQEAS